MQGERAILVLFVLFLLLASGRAFARQKHTDADYKIGWLEFWTEKTWGPDVYYDSQNGITCFASHDHELPQCYKDSNSNQWVIKVSDDTYVQVATGDNSPLPRLADVNKDNPLLELNEQCLLAVPREASKRIAEQEVAVENSVTQGTATMVGCAISVRYRIEGSVVFVPLYRKGKIVDEVGYDNTFVEHTPGGRATGGPRNNFFVDVWEYSK